MHSEDNRIRTTGRHVQSLVRCHEPSAACVLLQGAGSPATSFSTDVTNSHRPPQPLPQCANRRSGLLFTTERHKKHYRFRSRASTACTSSADDVRNERASSSCPAHVAFCAAGPRRWNWWDGRAFAIEPQVHARLQLRTAAAAASLVTVFLVMRTHLQHSVSVQQAVSVQQDTVARFG
jgi:hypothetical protein